MTDVHGSRTGILISKLAGKKGAIAPALFLLLTLVVFNNTLIDASRVVGSAFSDDLSLQFLPWRKFGFDQLVHGNLPLWNPHVFGGAPYFGGFQSALLYPPNWLHLILPVGLAINWINALHVFAAGYFTNLWCRSRGLAMVPSILAGVMFMFSGAYFPRIYAGHLPHIAIMVWAPLLFLSIDLLIKGAIARGTLLGIFVMAMFLLAGHPQYVYYTGLVAGLYVAINLRRFKSISHGIAGCAMIVLGGTSLAAVQVLTGLDAASESVRSGGTSYHFASMFSFPPENLLTTIMPNVYGSLPAQISDVPPQTYFGRIYLWEASLFVSITGLILAMYGAIAVPWRVTRGAPVLTAVCFILALGAHTPIHRLLYDYLPGFSMFRGSAKFNYLVVLFLGLLAAYGLDELLRAKKVSKALFVIAGAVLGITFGLSEAIGHSSAYGLKGTWAKSVSSIYQTAIHAEEMTFEHELFENNDRFFKAAGQVTSNALANGTCVLGVIITIFLISRIRFALVLLLVPVAVIELGFNAFSWRATTESTPRIPEGWPELINELPANARILAIENENLGMWMGYYDAWGYDPNILKRYAEAMAFAQGWDPNSAGQYVQFRRTHFNIFPLMRVSAILFDNPSEPKIPTPKPMELAQLVPNATVLDNRDSILWALQPNEFEPRDLVILERNPNVQLSNKKSISGTVKVLRQSTDDIEFEIDSADNAVLLVTNAYSHGWRVRSIGPSIQDEYEVMPADWAFQGIPLLAGRHHFILEYRPQLFVIGKWISILALICYVATGVSIWRRSPRAIVCGDSSPR